MMICGRSCIAALVACTVLLSSTAPAFASYNAEAGRKYAVASQRYADLRKSPKKKKYRSYWIDCIRTFESIEKKYPRSPSAGDACFDAAGVYQDLYLFNKFSRDLESSLQMNARCQSSYPDHPRAPEALFHIIELTAAFRKNTGPANETLAKLAKLYPESDWTKKARTLLDPPVRTARKKNKQEPELRKMPTPVIASPAQGAPDATVSSIRFWSGGAYTRIVIDQDKPIKYRATELKKPDRLVFDLLNTKLSSSVDREPLAVNDGILKQVRASQYERDVVRVVLDLASIKSYLAFPLHDPDRLVIDVNGEGSKTSPEQVEQSSATSTPQKQDTAPAQHAAPSVALPSKTPEAKNGGDDRLTLSRQLGLKVKTIAIDAGHGGHDPGALGKGGLQEKQVTLDIAKKLAVLVRERLGCTVVLTRDRDVFIPLEERPFIAKSKNADLFVSIHVNANRKRKTRGIETYIQSLRASDRDAMATAARENAMSTKKLSQLKSELDRIFADFARDDKIEESLQLAHLVQGSLVDVVKPVKRQMVNHGVKRAFFYVLINTEMPSILAEVGFISNTEEEQLLKKDSYRQSIAEALYQGVKKYVDSRGPQVAGL